MEVSRRHTILLVEDNPADVKIMQRALSHSASRAELVVVRDGQEALDYLLRQGAYTADRPNGHPLPAPWTCPDLIVLDLNLPRVSGAEVLRKVREAPPLSLTPVVVLSTSRHPEDVREAYAAGANTYLEKPRKFDHFVEMLRMVQQFWLEMAVLPPAPVA